MNKFLLTKKAGWGILILILINISPVYATFSPFRVTVDITFSNETDQDIVQTMNPLLDSFSDVQAAQGKNFFKFISPLSTITPGATSKATISYPWLTTWYGMSQYAYNFQGRSANYGCFITQIRLSGARYKYLNFPWWPASKYIVIASYRKDPAYPDDYMVCDVSHDLTVHIRSNKTKGDQVSVDDSKRYSIRGDATELKNISDYHIDKPIRLWVDTEANKAFIIKPNQSEPVLVGNDFFQPDEAPKNTRAITVVNLTNEVLTKGPLVVDDFSQLSKQYYIEQPETIQPGESKQIKMGMPDFGDIAIARFNYYIQGYSADSGTKSSGCYITSIARGSLLTSFHFHPDHLLDKNLYCVLVPSSPYNQGNDPTVIIYDSIQKGHDDLQVCTSLLDGNCVSYYWSLNYADMRILGVTDKYLFDNDYCEETWTDGYVPDDTSYTFDLDPSHKINITRQYHCTPPFYKYSYDDFIPPP